MRHGSFGAMGIKSGQFKACEVNLVPIFFKLLTFIQEAPISYYPREWKIRKGIYLKWMRQNGFSALGI